MFVAEGVKIVDEILHSGIAVKEIFALMEWIEDNKTVLGKKGLEAVRVNQNELGRISNLSTPNKVLAVCKIPDRNIDQAEQEGIILALDGIRDPGRRGCLLAFVLKAISHTPADIILEATRGGMPASTHGTQEHVLGGHSCANS